MGTPLILKFKVAKVKDNCYNSKDAFLFPCLETNRPEARHHGLIIGSIVNTVDLGTVALVQVVVVLRVAGQMQLGYSSISRDSTTEYDDDDDTHTSKSRHRPATDHRTRESYVRQGLA